jgi:hypothetical protein
MARRSAAPAAAPVIHTEVGHGIDLPPEALYFASWRNTPPLPRPEPRPFDRAECLARLGRVKDYSPHGTDWASAAIAPGLSREEADFWLTAMARWCENRPAADVAQKIGALKFTGETGLPLMREVLIRPHRVPPPEMAGVLATLLGPVRFLTELMTGGFRQSEGHPWGNLGHTELNLVRASWTRVRPYLSVEEAAEVRERLRPRLDPSAWPKKYGDAPAIAYYVAALVGMHDEIWELVRGWQFGPNDPARYLLNNYSALLVLLGLRDPALLELKAREIGLILHTPFDLRAWLAHMDIAGVGYAAEQIERQRYGNRAIIEELARVRDPVAARPMLALRVKGKNPAPARAWLDENIGSAVAGLLPLVAGRDKVSQAAVEYLRDLAKRGYGGVIERELATAEAQLVGKVRRAVLERPERVLPSFESDTEPEWLREMVAGVPKPKGAPPAWLSVATLPPIVVDGRRLSESHVTALLNEQRAIPAGNVAPFAAAVVQHAEAASRDAFAAELFERWLAEKSPHQDSWVLAAAGRLGGDATVGALVPRLRRWPGGGSSTRRHKSGLAVIRAIGTDYALAQLAHLALTHPNHRVKTIATESLSAAAMERGLSADQLEDRTVPDLGLSAGGPVVDYGPRQFRLALGPDLRPAARDERGKLHVSLPTPRKSDDALRVAEAREAFRQFKTQTNEVLGAICRRLERGLVHQRRWTADDFARFLVGHPITGAVARRLVWGWFGLDGSLAGTFRVTDEGEYAGPDDRPAVGTAFQVGLVHPVQLGEADRAAWAERCADYELIPPFAQLARPVFELTDEERTQTETTRFNAKQIPWRAVYRLVKENGWIRRDVAVRPFPAAGLTAVVRLAGWDRVEVRGCIFLPRVDLNASFDEAAGIPLMHVDPLVRCEVFADLQTWASAANSDG